MNAPIPQPRLGKAIQAAMKRKGFDTPLALTLALGMPVKQRPAVYNWIAGKNAPGPERRAKLAQVLDLDIEKHIDQNKTAKVATPRLGPAQRAVALVQQAQVNGRETILPPAPAVSDVFTFRARSDGTIIVKLDTVLPYARGVQLINSLLGFGLVIGTEDAV